MKALLLSTSLVLGVSLAAWTSIPRPAAANDTKSALERLCAGNERHARGEPSHAHQNLERRGAVAKGQAPFAVIVGCADSRVPPELVFDQGLGDLFVVRCAGNVLGDAAIGSIEYAVEHLGCELVVVLAHERCGAVDAVLASGAVEGGHLPGHMAAFAPSIEPVIAEAVRRGGDVLDNAVRLNAERIAAELRASQPILAEYVGRSMLMIVPALYDLDTGEVEWLKLGATELEDGDAPPASGEPRAHPRH